MEKLVFIALAGLLISCGPSAPKETEKEEENLPEDIVELSVEQLKNAGIEMGSVEMRKINGIIKASGVIAVSPQNLAYVCAPMGGYVKNTELVEGSPVIKGQILALLENQEFIDLQLNYLEAKSKFEFIEMEYKRHKELYKEDVYSAQNFQQVSSDYKIQKAQVYALSQKLLLIGINPDDLHEDDISRTVGVVSPISGYIKTAGISIGKYMAPADVMFEIVNTDKMYLELTLFEKDINKVLPGDIIHFSLNNEEENHEATTFQVGKALDNDKSFKLYAKVINPCKNILPGMFVNASIETEGHMVTVLPSQAVVRFEEKFYIFIFEREKEENGKPFTEFKMIEVQCGIVGQKYTEVILPQTFDMKNTKVIIEGAYQVLAAKKNAGEMSCG